MAANPKDAHQVSDEITGELDARRKSGAGATVAMRELAERQHGVVAHRQLVEIGVAAGLIQGRLESGHLVPVHRGVFALGRLGIGRKGEWMATVLACGSGAVLSHGSAGQLWGIRGTFGAPEVTRRSGGSPRLGIRLHQTRVLEAGEVTEKDRIPVTSVERTLLDLAARLDTKQLERAVVAADRTGSLRWPELLRLLNRTPRRPGVGRLRKVALAADPRSVAAASPLELDFLALCREAELPSPLVNVLVNGHLVDFLWPTERVIVETDGYTYHRDRPAFERDREHTVTLEAAGYLVHRATYRMLARNPAPFMQLVRRSFHRRRDRALYPPASSSRAISSRT
jgi:hypothetical protein